MLGCNCDGEFRITRQAVTPACIDTTLNLSFKPNKAASCFVNRNATHQVVFITQQGEKCTRRTYLNEQKMTKAMKSRASEKILP